MASGRVAVELGHADVENGHVRQHLQGQADGSIRKDIGNPAQVCVMLWAFTHGLIQIGINKAWEIERLGVEVPRLMEDSFAMLRYMLAADPRR